MKKITIRFRYFAAVVFLMVAAIPVYALDVNKINALIPPEPSSQEEAEICRAVFSELYHKTGKSDHLKLSALWLGIGSRLKGVSVSQYSKEQTQNAGVFRFFGSEPQKFYFKYCYEQSQKILKEGWKSPVPQNEDGTTQALSSNVPKPSNEN